MAEAENNPDPAAQPQPGAVITPGGGPQPQAPEPVKLSPAPTPLEVPQPQAAPEPEEAQPAPARPPLQEPDAANANDGVDNVNWTASEFVAHDKSAGWYCILAVAMAAAAALIFLITKDIISVAVVVVAGTVLGIYASHKPRQLEYQIDNQGIGIGQKRYDYREFKSFSVMPEGAFASIIFMPLKRFSPPLAIYYAPDDEDKIMGFLLDRLPFEEHKPDAADRLVRRIRF